MKKSIIRKGIMVLIGSLIGGGLAIFQAHKQDEYWEKKSQLNYQLEVAEYEECFVNKNVNSMMLPEPEVVELTQESVEILEQEQPVQNDISSLYIITGEYADNYDFSAYLEEEELLAQISVCEAGNSTVEDMTYVQCVILNRIRTERAYFKNVTSVYSALYQNEGKPSQQYGKATIQKIEDGRAEAHPRMEEARKIAHALLTGQIPCLKENVLGQTTDCDYVRRHLKEWGMEEVQLPGKYNEIYSKPIGE